MIRQPKEWRAGRAGLALLLLAAVVGADLAVAGLAAGRPIDGSGYLEQTQEEATSPLEQILILVSAGVESETIRTWLEARGGPPPLDARAFDALRAAGASADLLSFLGAGKPEALSIPPADQPPEPSPTSNPVPAPRTPGVHFTARVERVRVPAVVIDADGNYVRGLQASDFQLWDGEQPQEIETVLEVNAPVSVGLLIDTSGSMAVNREATLDALEHLFRTLQADDDVFVIGFSGRPRLTTPPTADRQRLRGVGNTLRMTGSTALYDAVIMGLQVLQDAAAEKRALVVITDGNDTASRADLTDALAAASRSEVAIYTVGIGHRTSSRDSRDDHDSGTTTIRGASARSSRVDYDADVLQALAEATGGRAYLLLDEAHHHPDIDDPLRAAATAIAVELNHEYLLVYTPEPLPAPGDWRPIRVAVGLDGYEVRARPGYVWAVDRSASGR